MTQPEVSGSRWIPISLLALSFLTTMMLIARTLANAAFATGPHLDLPPQELT
jgi:hypothetical protein